jgi:hypothetical protein
MSDIVSAVVAKLNADADLAALIGTRNYPNYDRRINKTYPLAVYRFDLSPVEAFDGPSGLMEATLEIAGVAKTYNAAKAVGDAIYSALEGQRGTWSGVEVQGIFLQDNGRREDNVVEPTTEEVLYFVQTLTFDIKFTG